MAYSIRRDTTQRHAAQEDSEVEEKLKVASSACRHAAGVKVAARTLSCRAVLISKREDVDHGGGQIPVKRRNPRFCGRDECSASESHRDRMEILPHGARAIGMPPRVFFDVISSRDALLGPRNDG